ncbi:hypothetical protein DSO57_1007492 [Entomophthora muscae]|uniref:Uncharacterized protein n=1 Tax=Entomophthora muscae TaxID=34485 RepID=A0ACC2TIM8_9FUNG|nr:hypothetical protein DSO57_1007492 [Entomophthora muscae]
MAWVTPRRTFGQGKETILEGPLDDKSHPHHIIGSHGPRAPHSDVRNHLVSKPQHGQMGKPKLNVIVTAHTRVQLDSHRGGRPGLEGHVHNRRYTNQWLGAPTPSMGHNLVSQPQYCDINKTQLAKVLGGRRVGERRGSWNIFHCWWQIQVMGMEILQVKGAGWFGKDNRSMAGRIWVCKFVLSSGFTNGCKENN